MSKKLVFTCPKCGSHDLTECGRSEYEARQFTLSNIEGSPDECMSHMVDYGEVELTENEHTPVIYGYACSKCGRSVLDIGDCEDSHAAHLELLNFAMDNEPMFMFVEEESKIELEPLVQVLPFPEHIMTTDGWMRTSELDRD